MRKNDFIRGDRGYLPPGAQLGLFSLPRRREFLMAHCGNPPKDVLDVGCAGGYVATLLERQGHRVLGIELNARMASEARLRGLDVVESDLEEPLPLTDGCVDVIHACEIIEHLFDTEGFLLELHRVLRPGGTLILSTPNLNSAINRYRVLLGYSLPMWGAFPADRHGGHIRVFNKAKIESLVCRTGFRVDEVVGINQGRGPALLDRFPTLSELILLKATCVKGSTDAASDAQLAQDAGKAL